MTRLFAHMDLQVLAKYEKNAKEWVERTSCRYKGAMKVEGSCFLFVVVVLVEVLAAVVVGSGDGVVVWVHVSA